MFISRIEKPSNNIYIICIKHIKAQAWNILQGKDFLPCIKGDTWILVENHFKIILIELKMTLPKIPIVFKSLPFLMPTYKLL